MSPAITGPKAAPGMVISPMVPATVAKDGIPKHSPVSRDCIIRSGPIVSPKIKVHT